MKINLIMKTFFVETWGCQMNQHDSELIEGQLRLHGLSPVEEALDADLVVLNTCSVRDKPVQKIISRIGFLAKYNPTTTIGVCGCVAEQEAGALLKRSRSVGFVIGPGQTARIGEAVRAVVQGERPVLTGFDAETDYNFHSIFRKSTTRGMVTVIEGCNEFCTFCIVPYTRGREMSRTMDQVLTEIRSLASEGVKEVELLGQTINAYRCPDTGANLAGLLENAASVEGLLRVRFITSHPRHFGQDLIDVLANHPNVFRYLHLPVQSGSNEVLARMHRKYTREEYLDLVDRIRSAAPTSSSVSPGKQRRISRTPWPSSKRSDSVRSSRSASLRDPRRRRLDTNRRSAMPSRAPGSNGSSVAAMRSPANSITPSSVGRFRSSSTDPADEIPGTGRGGETTTGWSTSLGAAAKRSATLSKSRSSAPETTRWSARSSVGQFDCPPFSPKFS